MQGVIEYVTVTAQHGGSGMVSIAFLIAALVCFIIGTFGASTGKFNMTNAGLACLTASMLLVKI